MSEADVKRIVLVRHGQTEWNALGRAQGHTDIPLDHVGRAQADCAAAALASFGATEVWCSDLARCRDTARAVASARGAALVEMRELRERGFGEWEGQQMTELRANLGARANELGIPYEQMRPPGGESLEDVWRRVDGVVERIRSFRDNLIVVSHGGVMGILIARLIRGTLQTARSFRVSNACICELEHSPNTDVFRLVRFDDVTHLTT